MNRFIKRVGWLSTLAILFTMSRVQAETQTNSPGGNVSAGNAGSLTHNEVDQILANARQAMAHGDLAKADTLVKRAEAAKPKYPVLHFGDTPARVRRDLEKLATSRPAGTPSSTTSRIGVAKTDEVANPFTLQQANAPANQHASTPTPPASVPHVVTPAAAEPAGTREECNEQIMAARRALIVGDLPQATKHFQKAQQCQVVYADAEDSPSRVAQSLADLRQLEASKDNSSSWKYNYAKFLLSQGEALLAWGDLDNAERAAAEAAGLTASIAVEDNAPGHLLNRIAQSRKQRDALPTGNPDNRMIVDQAVAPAVAAVPVDLTLPNFEQLPEVPRIAQLPTVDPEPLPTTDTVPPTKNLVLDQMDPFALVQEGEIALRAGDRTEALKLFRLAHAKRDQLDFENQQRLQDHLQMLASNPNASATQGGDSLIEDASSTQAVMARQLSADIEKRQTEAAKLRETDPKKSLAILQEAGELVTKSELDESTKTQLMRRLSLSIAKTDRYIKDHGAELELDEANKDALADVERERAVKAQVQGKMAEMVEQFNQLRDEHRYAEMEVVAKRLYEMAPDDPVAQLVWENCKFIRRTVLNRELKDVAEGAVIGVLQDLERTKGEALASAIQPITYDAETWEEISKRPGSTNTDAYSTESELEIKRKLKTQVLPSYNDMPLSEVIDGLSKLAGINIHLDPLGLDQEGVQPDTGVTLNLGREISLESALNLILEPLHLTYMIKDEVLKVTSEQIRDGEVVPRIYKRGRPGDSDSKLCAQQQYGPAGFD